MRAKGINLWKRIGIPKSAYLGCPVHPPLRIATLTKRFLDLADLRMKTLVQNMQTRSVVYEDVLT